MIASDSPAVPSIPKSRVITLVIFKRFVSVIQMYNLMERRAPIDWEQPFIWDVQMSCVLIQYPWFDEKSDVCSN